MRRAFGKTVGTAARLECNQAIYTVYTEAANAKAVRNALWRASMKLPSPCYVDVEKGQELIR